MPNMRTLSKSIKLPSIAYAQGQLDNLVRKYEEELAVQAMVPRERDGRRPFYFKSRREYETDIAAWRYNLAYAQWCNQYVANNDVVPVIVENRTNLYGERRAEVLVQTVKYRVHIAMGRRVRIAFKPRGQNIGHHWHKYVSYFDTSTQQWYALVKGDRCEKSAGITSAAVLAHLHRVYQHEKSIATAPL